MISPMADPDSPRPIAAGTTYAGLVFLAGFIAGTIRTLLIAPRIGALAAVAIELPVMLAVSWLVCGLALRRYPLPGGGTRVTMAVAAFVTLMAAEFALATLLGQTSADYAAALATPPGLLGLAGQIAFALLALARR